MYDPQGKRGCACAFNAHGHIEASFKKAWKKVETLTRPCESKNGCTVRTKGWDVDR